MEIRPYGLYFHSKDETVFHRVLPSYNSSFHGGATVNKETYLQDKKFLNMVGFGGVESADHEFSHMFNSLPLHDVTVQYEKIHDNINLPQNREGIHTVKSKQYELWTNSVLKDEILARIDNDQILKVEEQTANDVYSGEGKVFTTYKPDSLYGYISPYKPDVEDFGVEPVSRETSDEFWKLYDAVVDPIHQHWLDIYNQNIRVIKDAVQRGIPKTKIKAIIITEKFEDIAAKVGGLLHPTVSQ